MHSQILQTETSIQVSNNPIVMALQGKKIKNCDDLELGMKISACVEKAWSDLGLKQVSNDDFALLKFGIMSECRMSFQQLTLNEIEAAIHNGVRGKYGEVFGLSVIGVAKWFSSYMMALERQDGKKQLEKLQEQKPEPTTAEKFITGKKLSVDLFEKFKKSQLFDRTTIAVYEFCKQHDLIDKDYRKGVYHEAIDLLLKSKEQESAMCTDLYKRRRLNGELELFKDNVSKDILTPDQHNEVLRSAKQIALTNWFIDLINTDEDFDQLIESKRP